MNRLVLTLMMVVLVAGMAGAQATVFPTTGPTRVSQAANLVTSALHSAPVATDLLFAPANNTEYHIQGKLFVASDTVAYGMGLKFVAPTTDAIEGSCVVEMPSSTTVADAETALLVAGAASATLATTVSVPPLSTVTFYRLKCYLSTTTTTSGNFAVLFGGENPAGSVTLYAGSYIDYEALP